VLRVPGSIHRKALRRVRYVIQLDDAGKGFTYTLPELAEALDLHALDSDLPEATRKLARPAQYRKVKNPGSAPLRTHGAQAMNALRAQDLRVLEQHRGGFRQRGVKYPDGSTSPGRRFTLTLYLDFLRGHKLDQAAALTALRAMAANMIPPWPEPGDPTPETLIEAEYSKAKRRRWTNKKLCPLLGITADLARQLDLKTIRPLDVAREADQARPLQADVIAARRAWLFDLIQGGRKPRSARSLARLYEAAGFTGANPETANQDLNALGFVVTRSRGGRPRKAAQTGGGAMRLPTWLQSKKVGK
jgi:hypothetical protein